MSSNNPILFFDGQCGLCNHFVDWVMARDRYRVFRFSPIQGKTAREILSDKDYAELARLESIALFDQGRVLFKSLAVLEVMRCLGGRWRLLSALSLIIPRSLRDLTYDWIANNRYRWFGRSDVCRIPTAEERALFLD